MAQQATPSYMGPSGRGQRSDLVRWVGVMNGCGSQPRSRLAAVTFARELNRLNRAAARLNIKSQWEDPQIWFFVIKAYYKN